MKGRYAVGLLIPADDRRPLAWWRERAVGQLRDVLAASDRKPHGRIGCQVTHGDPSQIVASCDSRPWVQP